MELSAQAATRAITAALAEVERGDATAWDRLVELVYPQLRALAARELRGERVRDLLNTTALVHEAWAKVAGDASERMESRTHFFAAAARAMRRVLVDDARRRKAQRRGEGARPVAIDSVIANELALAPRDADDELELLDCALERLAERANGRDKSRVVELRFFAGLTNEQVAEVLGVSPATVKRDWEFARAWLRREMERLSA